MYDWLRPSFAIVTRPSRTCRKEIVRTFQYATEKYAGLGLKIERRKGVIEKEESLENSNKREKGGDGKGGNPKKN